MHIDIHLWPRGSSEVLDGVQEVSNAINVELIEDVTNCGKVRAITTKAQNILKRACELKVVNIGWLDR